ncbi:hypothetical protein SeMB42_g00807 [Synchytrium endobioticum]|uniref:HSF-type DNA-binding domain-containing protein n=1 Tax=Synchytrium endobioticum TaxID=286115 RepID=A0A507DP22_9FUNG|nr:hypothetical protein SeMB42_g00807 [Synchytrium endobioticum]
MNLLQLLLILAISSAFAARNKSHSTVKFDPKHRKTSVKTGAGTITFNNTRGADNKTTTGLDVHVKITGIDTKTYGSSFTYFIATYGVSGNNCTWPGAAMPKGDISAMAGPLLADAAGNIARVDHIPTLRVQDLQGRAVVVVDSKGERVMCSNIGPKKQNPAYLALYPKSGPRHSGVPRAPGGAIAASVTAGALTDHSMNILATAFSLIMVACVSLDHFFHCMIAVMGRETRGNTDYMHKSVPLVTHRPFSSVHFYQVKAESCTNWCMQGFKQDGQVLFKRVTFRVVHTPILDPSISNPYPSRHKRTHRHIYKATPSNRNGGSTTRVRYPSTTRTSIQFKVQLQIPSSKYYTMSKWLIIASALFMQQALVVTAKSASVIKFDDPKYVFEGFGTVTIRNNKNGDLDVGLNLTSLKPEKTYTYYISQYAVSHHNCTWAAGPLEPGKSDKFPPITGVNSSQRVDTLAASTVDSLQGRGIVLVDNTNKRVACGNIGSPKIENPLAYPNGVPSPDAANGNASACESRKTAATKRSRPPSSARPPTPGTPTSPPETAAMAQWLSAASSTTDSFMKQHLPSSATKNVPAFLNKLYNMVCDATTDDLIHWSDDGTSFIVQRHEEFSKEVLPRFFKHNNFSSFVRQLNMYGFHKVPHLQQGALHTDSDAESWEFTNQFFQRNQPDLLCLVSRKKGREGDDKDGALDIHHLVNEIATIKRHQLTISTDLKTIQQENQMLWNESQNLRQRYQKQQDTIDRIVKFLGTVFNGKKRLGSNDATGSTSGTIGDGNDNSSADKSNLSKRRRLLIAEGDVCPPPSESPEQLQDVVELLSTHTQHARQDLMGPAGLAFDHPAPHSHISDSEPVNSHSPFLSNFLIPNPPTTTPPLPPSTNAVGLPLSRPSDPPYMNNMQNAINNNSARTSRMEDEIDLLQDHLDSIADHLGLDADDSEFFADGLPDASMPSATSVPLSETLQHHLRGFTYPGDPSSYLSASDGDYASLENSLQGGFE